jgi:MFS family permease
VSVNGRCTPARRAGHGAEKHEQDCDPTHRSRLAARTQYLPRVATAVPVWRNRNFVLLEAGRFLSTLGSQSSAIAYPLLVLALTHSPAKAGIVSFAGTVPRPLLSVVAGYAADRGDRKRLMILADVVRAGAVGTLGLLVLLAHAPWWPIPIVALVEGTGSALFSAASAGALRAVVPTRQLPTAVGAQRARQSAVMLGGTPLGGALFQLGRSIPFLADAGSYAFSVISLLGMRTPFQEPRQRDTAPVRKQIAEGFGYLWSRPFLRSCALLYGLGNPLVTGILLVLVVVARRQHFSPAEIGALTASLGAAALAGATASPWFRRVLSIRSIMLLEYTTWFGAWLFVAWPTVYALLAVIIPFGIAAPITDSVVDGYRVAMTPDRLLGRVEAARTTIALLAAPFGPLVAGLLLEHASARVTVAVFAGFALTLFAWGYLSPAIRAAPSLDELEEAGTLVRLR